MDFCIRAKLNMQDKVKCLRDPVFYRTKDIPHHRTGDRFKAYPTYDFTCPIVDSKEGVTHALRTIEYRDRNALYAWVQKQLDLRPVEIYDFSKLNLLSTCLSKRKLRWFVENNHVDGWDDPRFPTIQGIMRRGMTQEALKQFMLDNGPSRNTVNMEWDKLWAYNKQILDPVVPRYTAIGKDSSIKLTIENGPSPPEARSQPLHPKNAAIGNKPVMFGQNLLIEKDDAAALVVGQKITLMKWGNATITRREESKDTFELTATIDEADKDFKGTTKLTWICNDPATTVEVTMIEFDHLITKAKIEEADDIEAIFNRNSRFEQTGIAEGIVKTIP
jgi:glutamyl-tRNA synthetase